MYVLLNQQPVIVERCNTARWNRLTETNRMVVVSSFYFASIYTARHPSTSCEASSCQYPIISIGQPLNRVLNSSESTYFHGGLSTGSINHLVPFHTTNLGTESHSKATTARDYPAPIVQLFTPSGILCSDHSDRK
ncbi:unnamed protein product [Rhizophagus irregularis]|nr:unnamed protein product [Rhizophagus irregularis]